VGTDLGDENVSVPELCGGDEICQRDGEGDLSAESFTEGREGRFVWGLLMAQWERIMVCCPSRHSEVLAKETDSAHERAAKVHLPGPADCSASPPLLVDHPR
jgi:hypothetical protein